MECETVRENLGRYLDQETSAEMRNQIDSHLSDCRKCAEELAELRSIATRVSAGLAPDVPADLWNSIEQTLDRQAQAAVPRSAFQRVRQLMAMAASVLFAVGVGATALLWTDGSAYQAQAASVDFGVLLDELPTDPGKAFRRFLVKYQAQRVSPVEAKRHAGDLDFDVPDTLPGGFQLRSVYALRFSGQPGVAAEYFRGAEFLGTIFHRPIQVASCCESRNCPCVIGSHRGHKVQVGSWTLVQMTDQTTCRCVLSKLDEQAELPTVVDALLP
jgi:hypothetical protein